MHLKGHLPVKCMSATVFVQAFRGQLRWPNMLPIRRIKQKQSKMTVTK